ncbi:unnamed protein product [Rotaria sordida]|nr:unnamed protein product [Rotaria sordida]CAF1639159.1 unnamed protein product [Rotaria sordida]
MAKVPTRQLGKTGPQVSAIGCGAIVFSADHSDAKLSNLEVFLGIKFALVMSPELKTYTVRGDAQYVHEACEKSLKRLGLSSVDLYYAHCIDKTVPIEETVGAMKELINAGKVKYLGLSNCSSDTLRRAHVVHPIGCVEIEYSPFSLNIECSVATF